MTNEQMERKMEFIVDTLARVAVNDEKHEMRLSRLERIAKLMVNVVFAGGVANFVYPNTDGELADIVSALERHAIELT